MLTPPRRIIFLAATVAITFEARSEAGSVINALLALVLYPLYLAFKALVDIFAQAEEMVGPHWFVNTRATLTTTQIAWCG